MLWMPIFFLIIVIFQEYTLIEGQSEIIFVLSYKMRYLIACMTVRWFG